MNELGAKSSESKVSFTIGLDDEDAVGTFWCHAFVAAAAGIGTVLEALMIRQLLQVRKLHDSPLTFRRRHVA